MTVYLCTCGTSAAKKLPREPRFDEDQAKALGGVEPAAEVVLDSFRNFSMDDEQALTTHLSAEIHSLARLGVGATDTVVLFSSETVDGEACAIAVRDYLLSARPGLQARVFKVEDLQVKDAERFRRFGVLNFIQAVLKEIEANGPAQCVLNPTGGFKSLVPYTVLIGMLEGIPAKYIFEQSNTLLTLPPLPIEFARGRIEPIRHLLERIQAETAIPREDFENLVAYDQRDYLAPLFEESGDDQLTFSSIGFLIYGYLTRPVSLVPYLSRRAFQDLIEIRRHPQIDPETFLHRVASDRAMLDQTREHGWSNGLVWLKPGRTKDRYLVSEEGWRLLVWRIALHDEYDQLMDRERSSDLGARFTAERRDQFEPFVRMDLYDRAADTATE